MKRVIDFLISFLGLLLMTPFLLIFIMLIYLEDKNNPFYIANRVGRNGKLFKMIKLRSMIVNAEKNGIESTSSNDARITKIGKKVRKYKLDEFTQLWNVLIGQMSLVGPRPNVLKDAEIYTEVEKELLLVKPGITDFSSIIFSDEGDILKGSDEPNLAYNQLIRPWKSRLGLIYIKNQATLLDLKIIIYTIISIFSKKNAIRFVVSELKRINVDPIVIKVAGRSEKLYPYPPPGSDQIVISR
jgi:lipopolysaccharide/colanic/teichoic acid biosynthesis glycosyltransferase